MTGFIKEMEKEQPDFCWRYQNVTDSIKQLERADGIYAEAVIVISPAEMYLQPHVLVNQAKKLLEKMNAFYTDDYPPVSPDRVRTKKLLRFAVVLLKKLFSF